MSNQEIYDASDLKKYRTELPNMTDDDMDPFEYRLYGHYKRVCGAGADGKCNETVRTTANKCQMSPDKVLATRQRLVDSGWISIAEPKNSRSPAVITIIDRWAENFERFTKRKPQLPSNALVLNIEQGDVEGQVVRHIVQLVRDNEHAVLNIEQLQKLIHEELFDISNLRSKEPIKNEQSIISDASQGSASEPTVKAKRDKLQTRAVDPNADKPLTPTPSPVKAKPAKAKKEETPEEKALRIAKGEILKAYYDAINRHEAGRSFTKEERDYALGSADVLATQGWTAEQVTKCIDVMKADEFWAGQALEMKHIRKHIGAKLRATPPATGTNGHRKPFVAPSLEDWLFDKYGTTNIVAYCIAPGNPREPELRAMYQQEIASLELDHIL